MENQHPTFGNGKICYIELPAIDIDQSAAFYKAVFGWDVRKRGDGTTGFDDSVCEVSGTWVTGRQPVGMHSMLIHIMVDDMTASLDAVIAQGGKIVQPVGLDAPEITAKISDPGGNIIGLYQHGGS